MNTAWILLIVAGVLEVGWAIGLKYTDGFNFRGRPLSCAATLAAMILSMYLLSVAVRSIPIGTGYAIWTGIGALGAATLGMIFFREPATAARIACLLMVVFGIVGLKLTSPAEAQEPVTGRPLTFYIGGYSGEKNKGIYRATLNTKDGTLSEPTLVAEAKNPSFLAAHPTLPVLYAVSEVSKPGGSVTAFRISNDGSLARESSQPSGGDSPCHVSVGHDGRYAFAANYGDGVATALPLASDGSIQPPSFVDAHVGQSADPRRQTGPHAHAFVPDVGGRWAISTDLGTDELIVCRIDDDKLTRVGATKLPPGSGPRHVVFAADSTFVYVCNELTNTLATFSFDRDSGKLEMMNVLPTLPEEFVGVSHCAEIALHPSGRFLYVSNRGHDSLALFRINTTYGHATPVGHIRTGGEQPRHFAIDHDGEFLLVANQRSDKVVAFRINTTNGMATPTGSTLTVGSPSCIRFVR